MSENQSTEARILDEILKEPDGYGKSVRLGMYSEAQRQALYAHWVESDTLRLDDMISLPETYRQEFLRHLLGDPTVGLPEVSRTFIIGLSPDEPKKRGDGSMYPPVILENGTTNSRRRFIKIEKPQTMTVRLAINALLQFGQHAEAEEQRGRLRELSLEELAEWQIAQKKAAKKRGQ